MFPTNSFITQLAHRLEMNNLNECLYFPKYFQIETVTVCNAHCVMCPRSHGKVNLGTPFITDELFDKFALEVSTFSTWIEQICVTGMGEPTLDPKLPERIGLLKKAGIKKTNISTNGSLLSQELVLELINKGIDGIWISINGFSKKTYEKVQVGLDFDEVIKNTENLIRLREKFRPNMEIRIRSVILDENKNEVDKWLDFWSHKLKPQDRIYAKPPHSFGNQVWTEEEQKISYYADKPCVSPFSTMIIRSDGRVSLCAADSNVNYELGNISQTAIREIWQNEKFRHVRSLHANGMRNEIEMCRGCDCWNRDSVENHGISSE